MGVLSGKDLFNSKFVTAVITDGSSQLHFVPIKHTIGDYFVADISGQLYVFKIDGARIKTYKNTLAKSFRCLMYDTTHFLPISDKVRELEILLSENSLPKVNMTLFKILKLFGKREKQQFVTHRIQDLIEEVSEHEDEFAEQARNIKMYLDQLNVKEIITPVKKITEFIESDLLATDPAFLGTMIQTWQRVDSEHKKVTNVPDKGKKSFVVLMLLLGLVIAVGVALYYANEAGAFEGIGSGLSQFSGSNGYDQESLMSRYPSGDALKNAVDAGQLDYNKLPKTVQEMVDLARAPKG